MNDDRVLSFLNLDREAKRDEFMPKLDWGMNVFFTIFVLAFILLSSLSKFNIALAISFVVVDLLFGVILIINRNPVWQIVLDSLGLLLIVAKLFIGYISLSIWQFKKEEIPIFTWVHTIVFILALILATYMVSWLYEAYKISKKYPVHIARKEVKKIKTPKKALYVVTGLFSCPVIVAQWWYSRFAKFGLSIGFILWILALIFASILSASVLKVIVILRYKAYNHFKNK